MLISHRVEDKNNNFNLIRYIAAIMVIYSHAYALNGVNEKSPPFIKDTWGGLAVKTFLIISGFLVCKSWFNNSNTKRFIKARVLRIFPALVVITIVSVFILGPLVTVLPLDEYFTSKQTYRYLKNIFLFKIEYVLPGVYINNIYKFAVNGSLWSLTYEVAFYIIIILLGRSKILNNKYINLLIFMSALMLIKFNIVENLHIENLKLSISLFSYFFIGALYYVFKDYVYLNKYLAYICISILILSSFLGGFKSEDFLILWSYLVIYIGLLPSIIPEKIKFHGDYSYGIYIYAFPIQQLIIYILGGKMNPIINFCVSVILVFVVSILSWHFVEKKCLSFK